MTEKNATLTKTLDNLLQTIAINLLALLKLTEINDDGDPTLKSDVKKMIHHKIDEIFNH